MAWSASDAGAHAFIRGDPSPPPADARPEGFILQGLAPALRRAGFIAPTTGLARYRGAAGGAWRLFNPDKVPLYRFYRHTSRPPDLSLDSPFATSTSLPDPPAVAWGNGKWWLSIELHNGLYSSGFAPVGPSGETYIIIEIADEEVVEAPPLGPLTFSVEPWSEADMADGFGGMMVYATWRPPSSTPFKPHQWTIGVSVGGPIPDIDHTSFTKNIRMGGGLARLIYRARLAPGGIPNGLPLNLILQVRRNDGTADVPAWIYSEEYLRASVIIDGVAPVLPVGQDMHLGAIPEGL